MKYYIVLYWLSHRKIVSSLSSVNTEFLKLFKECNEAYGPPRLIGYNNDAPHREIEYLKTSPSNYWHITLNVAKDQRWVSLFKFDSIKKIRNTAKKFALPPSVELWDPNGCKRSISLGKDDD